MLVQTPRLPQTSRLELASIQAKGAGDTHTERYTGVLPGVCRGQAEGLSWLGARHGCVEGFTIARVEVSNQWRGRGSLPPTYYHTFIVSLGNSSQVKTKSDMYSMDHRMDLPVLCLRGKRNAISYSAS